MPTVKILKDCEASENGVNLIQFTKGQEITVSGPMYDLLVGIGGVKGKPGPKVRTQEDKAAPLETPEDR